MTCLAGVAPHQRALLTAELGTLPAEDVRCPDRISASFGLFTDEPDPVGAFAPPALLVAGRPSSALEPVLTAVERLLARVFESRFEREGGRAASSLLTRQLTTREVQVLRLLAVGTRSRSIAVNLGISPNTVRTHVQNILAKLGCSSRLEASAVAHGAGLV